MPISLSTAESQPTPLKITERDHGANNKSSTLIISPFHLGATLITPTNLPMIRSPNLRPVNAGSAQI